MTPAEYGHHLADQWAATWLLRDVLDEAAEQPTP